MPCKWLVMLWTCSTKVQILISYVGPFIKSDEIIFNKQGGKERRNLASALTSIGGTGGGCLAMNIEMFLNICYPPNASPVSWQVHWSVTAEYPLVCSLMLKMSLPWKFLDHFSFFAKTHCLEHADFKKLCHQFFSNGDVIHTQIRSDIIIQCHKLSYKGNREIYFIYVVSIIEINVL